MQRYFGLSQDTAGNIIPSVAVTVKLLGTGTLASLYSANDILSTLTNPFSSNADGTYQFYAPNGRFDVTLAKAGFTFTATETADVLFNDPAGTVSPAPLVGTTNDYSPGGGPGGADSAVWLLTTNALTVTITGIAAPQTSAGARAIRIYNTDTNFNINLAFNSGSSSAANRLVMANGRDYVLFPSEWVDLVYNFTTTRWAVGAYQSVRVTNSVGAGTTISNSAAETTIYSATVQGGLLGTASRLRLTLTGKFTNTTGGNSGLTPRFKYGGGTLIGTVQTLTNAVTDGSYRVVWDLIAVGATNAQELCVFQGVVTGTDTFTLTRGVFAIASTADQTLTVTAVLGAASNLLTFTRTAAALEWLP